MHYHFKSILMTLALAASLRTTFAIDIDFNATASNTTTAANTTTTSNSTTVGNSTTAGNTTTTSNATASTTILVGTEDTINDLVYTITFNGNGTIDLVTQTNVSNKAPSWLALNPTDNTKLLVVYEGSNEYQTFKIGQGGQLTPEFSAQDAGIGPAFGAFSKDGQFMVFTDFTEGGYVVARYFANGTSFPIPQEVNPDDPNRSLGPNATSPSHPHEFVEHPKLDVGYIPNLGANLTAFYQFKGGNLTFQGSLNVTGGPRHMVINKEGTFGWIVTETSCTIQPVKIDKAGNLTSNGDPVAITQANQAVGAGAEILLTQDETLIVVSNRQVTGSQNDFLTTFEVDSGGLLTNATTYDTKGQVVRGLAFNNDSTLLVFGHQTSGTVGIFGRDAKANKLTLLTPNLLNLTDAAKLKSPAAPSSFVFVN